MNMSKHIKHTERFPSAPTTDQQRHYNLRLDYVRRLLRLQYQTGPRYGQQLASIMRTRP